MVPGHQQGGGARGSHSNTLRDTRNCVKVKEKTLKDKSEQEQKTSLSGAGRSKHVFQGICVKAEETTALTDKSEQEQNTSFSGAGKKYKHLF